MAEFTYFTHDTAPEESKPLLEKSVRDFAMVPNLHALFAASPEGLQAYQMLHELFQKTAFDPTELTVVWQTINVEHGCTYCVPAHSMIAKMMNIDPAVNEALRNAASLSDPKLEALRVFTLAVTRARGVVSDADLEAFFAAGYTQRSVVDVLLGLAQKVMSNYINHMAQTKLDAPMQPFAWEKTPIAAE